MSQMVRDHCHALLVEWMSAPMCRPDLDAAAREDAYVREYVKTYLQLPPHALERLRITGLRRSCA